MNDNEKRMMMEVKLYVKSNKIIKHVSERIKRKKKNLL
jgi:hypothetical protein